MGRLEEALGCFQRALQLAPDNVRSRVEIAVTRLMRGDLQAGDSRATLSSDVLRADADGRLVGQVALQSQKPLPALSGLLESRQGAVNRVGAAGAAAAAGAADAAGREDVALTLVFRDGRTWLGPFPLAPAPKLF